MPEGETELVDDLLAALRDQSAPEGETETEAVAETDTEGPDSDAATEVPAMEDYFDHLPEVVKSAASSMSEDVRKALTEIAREKAEAVTSRDERDAQLTTASAELKEFRETFAPYEAALKKAGMTSAQYTRWLVNAKAEIDANPRKGIESLARQYDINLAAGDAETEPDEDTGSEAGLLKRIKSLEEEVGRTRSTQQEELRQEAAAAIKAFKTETDADGKLAHPHYDDARVQELMQTYFNSNQATELADAYDMAVMAHPGTRKLIIDAQIEAAKKAAADKRAEEAKAGAKAARTAASVSGDASGAGDESGALEPAAQAETSLEDDLKTELARQMRA